MSVPRLVLASASPRRLDLLRQIGVSPRVLPADLDERDREGESPRQRVLRLAEEKARHVAGHLTGERGPVVVLGADTAVVIDGLVLGKPRDDADAESMLRNLRNRTHEVLTGVYLLRTDEPRACGGVEGTRVRFGDFDDARLRAYVASGEPRGKAGAYGIQGRGTLLTAGIEGSWSNVVGLPLERLPGWMAEIGLDLGELLDWSEA